MKLNREQIIKAFECCTGIPNCNDCPLRPYPQNCKDVMENRALALIKELTEENERLKRDVEILEDVLDTSSRVLIQATRADTVQKMQELIHTNLPKVYGTLPHSRCFFNIVDQSAKEILEDEKGETSIS